MSAIPSIGDVMTPSPLYLDMRHSVREAQELMAERHIRHLPITDQGKPVSILTDRDINLAMAATKDLMRAEDLSIEEVCAVQTYMVEEATPLDEVVAFMAEQHIGSAVITRDGQLAGIFTVTDACRLLSVCLREEL